MAPTRATSAASGGATPTRRAAATPSSSSAGSQVFPREQLLIVPSDELARRARRETYARVLEFLGAPPQRLDVVPARLRARVRADEAGDARAARGASSSEPNRRLYELLGARARLELTRREPVGRTEADAGRPPPAGGRGERRPRARPASRRTPGRRRCRPPRRRSSLRRRAPPRSRAARPRRSGASSRACRSRRTRCRRRRRARATIGAEVATAKASETAAEPTSATRTGSM